MSILRQDEYRAEFMRRHWPMQSIEPDPELLKQARAFLLKLRGIQAQHGVTLEVDSDNYTLTVCDADEKPILTDILSEHPEVATRHVRLSAEEAEPILFARWRKFLEGRRKAAATPRPRQAMYGSFDWMWPDLDVEAALARLDELEKQAGAVTP